MSMVFCWGIGELIMFKGYGVRKFILMCFGSCFWCVNMM